MYSGLNFIHSDVFCKAAWELHHPSYVLSCDLAKPRDEYLAFVFLAMGELISVAFVQQTYFFFYFQKGFKNMLTWAKTSGMALPIFFTAFLPCLMFSDLVCFMEPFHLPFLASENTKAQDKGSTHQPFCSHLLHCWVPVTLSIVNSGPSRNFSHIDCQKRLVVQGPGDHGDEHVSQDVAYVRVCYSLGLESP